MLTTTRRPRPARTAPPTPRPAVRGRLLPAGLLLAALAVPLTPASAAAAAGPAGACPDADGVTVVVDATSLDGDVAVGCAEDPATGTEALAQAGFSEARDPSGFICAVDGLPDPCPVEFTGSFWSYWTASADGDWTSYAEGSDTSAPAPGSIEGWRYGDGSEPPAVEPAEVAPGTGTATSAGADEPSAAADDAAAADAATADPADEPADDGLLADIPAPWRPVVAVLAGLAVAAALVVVVVRLRRAGRGD